MPEAIFQGRISGEVVDGKLCAMFIGKDGAATPLAWPKGSRATGSAATWEVIDSQGTILGSAGKAVSLTGGQVSASIGGASVVAAGCPPVEDIIVVSDPQG